VKARCVLVVREAFHSEPAGSIGLFSCDACMLHPDPSFLLFPLVFGSPKKTNKHAGVNLPPYPHKTVNSNNIIRIPLRHLRDGAPRHRSQAFPSVSQRAVCRICGRKQQRRAASQPGPQTTRRSRTSSIMQTWCAIDSSRPSPPRRFWGTPGSCVIAVLVALARQQTTIMSRVPAERFEVDGVVEH